MNKKIILILVVLVIATALVYYFGNQYNWFKKLVELEPIEREESFGSQIYREAMNPAAMVPDTNPFSARTNPFEGIRLNPFK